MSLSVLSAVLVVAGVRPLSGTPQLSEKEFNAYRQLSPSIASILQGDQVVGTAALVDRSGLFLTQSDALDERKVVARLSDGRLVTMTLKALDEPSHLAILQAEDWIKTARPLVAADDLKAGDRLVAVLPSGLIRAEYRGQKSGLVRQTQSLVMLSEISFEAPADKIGGGLVMTRSGELVGFMNATLRAKSEANIQVQPSRVADADTGPVPAQPSIAGNSAFMARARPMKAQGPGDMTIAYTSSTKTLRKALQSLMTGKDVDRPSIGVDVKNPKNGVGALIQKIEPGSAADKAGLKVGDVVVEIDGRDIKDQMDLARVVMEREVGSTLLVKVRRGQAMWTFPVVVGVKSGSKNRLTPGSAT